MNIFSCNYQILRTLLLPVLLLLAAGGPGAAVWAQSTEVISVKALCAEGDYEWQGLVSDSVARHNPELRALLAELRKAQEKAAWEETFKDERQADKGLEEAAANLEKMKKQGLISDADYQKMKKELADSRQQRKAQANTARQLPGVSNPTALKEQLRKYCLGRRFYRNIRGAVDGLRCVEVGKGNAGTPSYDLCGFIDDRTGHVVIPVRYTRFWAGGDHVSFYNAHFNKLGMVLACTKDARWGVLGRNGREIIPPEYASLQFFSKYRILRAQKTPGGKWGIIDYDNHVLEPFLHDGTDTDGFAAAQRRIIQEKGLTPIDVY